MSGRYRNGVKQTRSTDRPRKTMKILSGKRFQWIAFDTDKKELKELIRAKTNDDMADEAKFVFESATKLFQDLMELDIEHYMEQTD